jgi:uncharacterized protein (TIGR00730 family)
MTEATHTGRIVSVFGSSRPRPGEIEYEEAFSLGGEIARAGYTVCNGGYAGIMEASSRGARESGGSTIGVICRVFGDRPANPWTAETIVTASLFERLDRLVSLGDAFVILKGGTGTLLEFALVWELMNKKMMHPKPIILLGNFWGGVVQTLREELAWEGLEECTRCVTSAGTPAECAAVLRRELEGHRERRRR